jgi:hypothetical protein
MQGLAKAMDLLNVTFLSFIPVSQLPFHIQKADLVLGIFGDTEKSQRVVPNKVYEGLAMAKPVITGDSPASESLSFPANTCIPYPWPTRKVWPRPSTASPRIANIAATWHSADTRISQLILPQSLSAD